MDMNAVRLQLAPGWSGVNIAIMIVLFLFFWPLGVAMVAYIIWGQQYGLNLARPETFLTLVKRLNSGGSGGGNQQEREQFEQWRRAETDRLAEERAALERDRAAFEASRREGVN